VIFFNSRWHAPDPFIIAFAHRFRMSFLHCCTIELQFYGTADTWTWQEGNGFSRELQYNIQDLTGNDEEDFYLITSEADIRKFYEKH
jgi:hypothetical protein